MDVDKSLDNEEIEEVEEEINETESLQDEKDSQIEDLTNKLTRLQADFTNFRKRTEIEKTSLVSYGIETLACDFLPFMDNFQRAMESQNDKEDGFYKGMEMIYNQFLDLLKKNNIVEIEALHQKFDPDFHHAVSMEDSEEYEAGTVCQVLQAGYLLGDKVIRHAMVIVAQ